MEIQGVKILLKWELAKLPQSENADTECDPTKKSESREVCHLEDVYLGSQVGDVLEITLNDKLF